MQITINCPSQIDRSSPCLKCGQADHKIVQCANNPHCSLCAEWDKNSHHIVGSYKCATNLRPSTIKTKTKTRGNPKDGNLKELHKEARLKLVKVIKASKAHCWDELVKEVEHDPWGRPYKVVMKRMKPQSLSSPTCPVLLEKIVTSLIPQQPDLQIGDLNSVEPVPPITLEELKSAYSRMGNKKAPGPDGIPKIALKKAIKIAPKMFLHMCNRCLQEGYFPAK